MEWKIIHIGETDSTNRWLRERGGAEDTVVVADYQTAGRGCGTNSWESERGRNLTFSMLIHPRGVPAASQFILSMANALALKAALDEYVEGIRIKWPNDIYWRDRKLCGTLIETTLQGSHIKDCIIGTGINVNQERFLSDAPNPVSLCQILGHTTDCQKVLGRVLHHTERYLQMVELGAWEHIRRAYHHQLYRLEELHDYQVAGQQVRGRLTGVSDEGHLQLLLQDGGGQRPASFAFKEIQFII